MPETRDKREGDAGEGGREGGGGGAPGCPEVIDIQECVSREEGLFSLLSSSLISSSLTERAT